METKPLEPSDILTSDDPILRGSYPAMLRAAREAREIAIRTGTGLIRRVDGKTVRIGTEELIREKEAEEAAERVVVAEKVVVAEGGNE